MLELMLNAPSYPFYRPDQLFLSSNVSTHEAGEDEILIHQFEDPSLEKFQFYDILKSFSLQADMWLMEQKFLPEGHIIILDMKNYSLRMVSKINIFFVREFFMYLLVRFEISCLINCLIYRHII